MQNYAGETLILPHMLTAWNNANKSNLTAEELENFLKREEVDDEITKLNFYIWQRYANAIWDDIREGNVLPFKDSREEDDEKHVTPTQLDVIDRIVELYSNPNEVVLSPFMGVGSDVFSPVSMGRKAIGIELKDSYFKQAILNLKDAEKRFKAKAKQTELF
jgi:DNA modification methylase